MSWVLVGQIVLLACVAAFLVVAVAAAFKGPEDKK